MRQIVLSVTEQEFALISLALHTQDQEHFAPLIARLYQQYNDATEYDIEAIQECFANVSTTAKAEIDSYSKGYRPNPLRSETNKEAPSYFRHRD